MIYKQEPPFALQVEFVEGCSLQCGFCGINGIRTKPGAFKFMSLATAERIVDELVRLRWTCRIEFAMHGEPSMHPRLADMIRLFRTALPRHSIMMLTNGTRFFKDPTSSIDEVMDAGLNTLGVDKYDGVPWAAAIAANYRGRYPLLINDIAGSGSVRRTGRHDVVVKEYVYRAFKKKSNADDLCNHCGGAAPLSGAQAGRRCAKPFREMSVRWDGNVALCCNDFRGVCKAGSVVDTSMDKIWNGPVFNAGRRLLYHGQRTEEPCLGCTAVSTRVGLLPDKMGKRDLPAPTVADRTTIRRACAGAPYTPAVLRPWEV